MKICAPLHDLTKRVKDKKSLQNIHTFLFMEEAHHAFKELKKHFTTVPVLTHFDPAR